MSYFRVPFNRVEKGEVSYVEMSRFINRYLDVEKMKELASKENFFIKDGNQKTVYTYDKIEDFHDKVLIVDDNNITKRFNKEDINIINPNNLFEKGIDEKGNLFVSTLTKMLSWWEYEYITYEPFLGFTFEECLYFLRSNDYRSTFLPIYLNMYIGYILGVDFVEDEILRDYKTEKGNEVKLIELMMDFNWIDDYIFKKVYPLLKDFLGDRVSFDLCDIHHEENIKKFGFKIHNIYIDKIGMHSRENIEGFLV